MSAPAEPAKPRLRGVSHQWAFVAAIVAGVWLVSTAPAGEPRVGAVVFAVSVCTLFGTSALYHRVTWRTARARAWMRRLDHTMIFFLIAGSYTPIALLTLEGTLGDVILIAVWSGALAGAVMRLFFLDLPYWLIALPYPVLGWVAVAATPQLYDGLGLGALLCIAGAGVLYTVGAAGGRRRRRPDPVPTVFGYHEVFHLLVIVATAINYAVIAVAVLPDA